MKITFLLADSVYAHLAGRPSLFCGAERQRWLLGRALAASGWRVTFGVQEGLALGRRAEIDGIEFVGIGGGRTLAAWRRFLLVERPDWCYWRGAYHLLGAGVEIAHLAGVATIFAAAFDSDVEPRRALTIRRRWWPLYAWGLARTDKILVQHQGQLTGLAERWRSKAAVVYSVAGPAPAMKPHAQREPYVTWVGQLRQPKRPDLLIEIARNAPDTRFVVCGGPTDHRSALGYGEGIRQTLNAVPNIDYRGFVAPAMAEQVIAGASALLCTSDAEGFPNTFLQAWAAGTPVLSLGIDPDGIIERAGLGIVSRGVENAVADIKALVDSPQSRQEMGLRARSHVAQTHSEESIVASFERVVGCAGAMNRRRALSALENPR